MTTRLYRNLNNGRWSIQQRHEGAWKVIGHAASATMRDVTVRLSKAGQARARRESARNVHLMVEGNLLQVTDFKSLKDRALAAGTACTLTHSTPPSAARGVTYNPFVHDTLTYRDNGAAFTTAPLVWFTSAQKMETSQ